MGERVHREFSVRSEVALAFEKACRERGCDPDGEIEAFMESYIRDLVRDQVVAAIPPGAAGEAQEELFKVDILCEDPLCIGPRIVMQGRISPEKGGKRG
jgi:hypothetical protein